MANIETTIDEMIAEMNGLKAIAIDGNVSALERSQINVRSMSSDKVVIHFNLNKELNESSVCDKMPKSEDPDNSYGNYDSDSNTGPNRENSANAPKPSADSTRGGSQPLPDQSFKGRFSRRTISESINEDTTGRGILKYSRNWIRRTVSESSCDVVVSDLDLIYYNQSIEDMFSDDEDMYCEKKSKKNVRFSESVAKTIFRPNSSILGRKNKNQKRKTNRKNRKNSESDDQSKDKHETDRTRQDSGYDSEDNGHNTLTDDSDKAHKHNDIIETETGIENVVFD